MSITIAAHVSFETNARHHLWDSLINLAGKHPEDHFIFLTDQANAPLAGISNNITIVPVKPAVKNGLSMYYWYNIKLAAILSRYNAAIFISDQNALSLRTAVPQLLFVQQLQFLKPARHPLKNFLLRYFPRFIQKAAAILTTEKYFASMISSQYPQAAGKLFTCYYGLKKQFAPMDREEKEKLTTEISMGYDYFLLYVQTGAEQHTIAALKAFSIFKKWQKSSMQLVILQEDSSYRIPGFKTYKYRDEAPVFIQQNDAHTARLMAAALAVVYLPLHPAEKITGLQALQSGTNLITTDSALQRDLYGHAAVYTGTDERDISGKMIQLYKDEELRKQKAGEGFALLQQYDGARAADALYRSIVQICEG